MYKTVTLWQFNYLLLRDYINKKIIICHRICMIIKFALPLRLKIYGVLAHLARARHWQCRGERFESAILHRQRIQSLSEFAFFMAYLQLVGQLQSRQVEV